MKGAKGALPVGMVAVSGFADRTRPIHLAINLDHLAVMERMPLDPRHRDPHDRMRIAQAQTERMALMTADGKLAAYDVEVIDPTK